MKDLTKGFPAKIIIMFAIPFMFGNILQQLYNMADSKIVSTYVGTTAFAAVGATTVVSNTIIGFLNGLTQGFTILVATSFGAKDMKRLRRFVAGTMKLTLISAVALTIFGLVFIVPILELLKTPADIMDDAVAYVSIIIGGIIFTALYNMCANILRAVGDSRTPLYCLVIAVIVNIGLDLLFVCGFSMGIRGAAYATVISQAISGISCGAFILLKFKSILPTKEDWHLERGQYSLLITNGLSMGLMGCIVNIGSIILQGAINGLGTAYVTAHTAARKVFDIMTVILYSISVAMTTFSSQNMGAGKPERVRQGVRHSLFICTGVTTVLIFICYIFGEGILSWISNTKDRAVLDSAVTYSRISILFFYVLGPLLVLRCTLQGMGRRIVPILSSIMEMLIKILSASFLVPAFGYMGVIYTEPISWVVMTIMLSAAYLSPKYRQ